MAERKRKRGRPRELDDPRSVPVWMEHRDLLRAARYAKAKGITVAETIRRALREYLNRRGTK